MPKLQVTKSIRCSNDSLGHIINLWCILSTRPLGHSSLPREKDIVSLSDIRKRSWRVIVLHEILNFVQEIKADVTRIRHDIFKCFIHWGTLASEVIIFSYKLSLHGLKNLQHLVLYVFLSKANISAASSQVFSDIWKYTLIRWLDFILKTGIHVFDLKECTIHRWCQIIKWVEESGFSAVISVWCSILEADSKCLVWSGQWPPDIRVTTLPPTTNRTTWGALGARANAPAGRRRPWSFPATEASARHRWRTTLRTTWSQKQTGPRTFISCT